jgi:flavin-dependent dehydrogenase
VDAKGPEYDVVILGGSLAGAATACLLLRERPNLRVLILEKSVRFPRRVGEATVEVSGYFLSRVLGLTQFLNETQLTKQGMRFWFSTPESATIADCGEIGGRYLSRVPAWQVDRSTLDEEVLRRAAEAGAEIRRPAKAIAVVLEPGGRQRTLLEAEDGREEVTSRWVVDGSGFTCLMARQEGWFRRNSDHPTTAAWARWRGVRDLDGLELAKRFPDWAAACRGIRATATNHLMGDGWWAWCIPLKGGDYSGGVVFDQRRVTFPEGPESLGQRLKAFLCAHPTGRELLENATPVEGDVKWRAHLAYCSDILATDGVVLVGDAAGFLDPFYSPGMDWLSYTVTRAADLVTRSLGGENARQAVEDYNRDFKRSYARWFDGIYRDKYDWLGDFELVRTGFRLDLAMYYIGVVSQPLQRGAAALREPVFSLPPSEIPYRIMRLYNRRLAAMARDRRVRGVFGRANHRRRFLLNGFLPERETGPAILKALGSWLVLEVREGWRSWFTATIPRSAGTAVAPGVSVRG